jgi:enterochelin esterase family protein
MKSLYLLAALSLATPVFSQSLVSPEVQPDGRVTFRLKAPSATNVQVQCESLKPATMQKDDQGIWSFTTEPLSPDYYGYSFVADGLRTIDLSNPLMKYNLLSSESEVHVPGPLSLPWEVNDVPHGVLHRHFYKSASVGDDRAYYVYTPPGYKASGRKRYPVLYLLHGFSDDAAAWWSVGQANIIMDNLIARGQARPMVVVMPLGYGIMDVLRAKGKVDENPLWQQNIDRFGVTLLDEVIPQVEKAYHVSTDRKNRAIAGLSMGGAESLTVGLNSLDRFAWIGSFSAGGVSTNYAARFPNLNPGVNKRLRLLWISCGREDHLFQRNLAFVDWLKSKDVQLTWKEVPGVHSWMVWRRNLAEFAPLLFQ